MLSIVDTLFPFNIINIFSTVFPAIHIYIWTLGSLSQLLRVNYYIHLIQLIPLAFINDFINTPATLYGSPGFI